MSAAHLIRVSSRALFNYPVPLAVCLQLILPWLPPAVLEATGALTGISPFGDGADALARANTSSFGMCQYPNLDIKQLFNSGWRGGVLWAGGCLCNINATFLSAL